MNIFITITSSKVTTEELAKVDSFLQAFLPRLRRFPGVLAVYHYNRPDKGDEVTIIIWQDEAAVKQYRESKLIIKEAIAYERQLNLPATREGYHVTYGAMREG